MITISDPHPVTEPCQSEVIHKAPMVAKYMVVALTEPRVITSAWLSHDGVKTEEQYSILGSHQATFDSELEALAFIQERLRPEFGEQLEEHGDPEHGYSIIKSYKN